ncbi:MAG: hypothetical protein GY710_03365 [Desulfobacteraceae bacterium]|nr:hypothetical protein [Desulfobacteraceae bacterium]
MWKLTDLNEEKKKPDNLYEQFEHYISKKNLNFIVARGNCINQRFMDLGQDKVKTYLRAYAACDFSMVALFNKKLAPPFIAADMDINQGLARVQYLIDFNEEAIAGQASPFYSKILGAFATNFFEVQPQIKQLWFPFSIENILGSKMQVQSKNQGTAILR